MFTGAANVKMLKMTNILNVPAHQQPMITPNKLKKIWTTAESLRLLMILTSHLVQAEAIFTDNLSMKYQQNMCAIMWIVGQNNIKIMALHSCSPDMILCDFLLFPKLKRSWKRRFEEIKTESPMKLNTTPKTEVEKCF